MIRYVTTIIKRTKIIHLFTTSIKWQQLKPKEGNVAQKSDLGTMFCGLLLSKLTTWMNQGWSPMNGCCLSLCLHDQLLESNKNAIAIILNQGRRKEEKYMGKLFNSKIRERRKMDIPDVASKIKWRRWIRALLCPIVRKRKGLCPRFRYFLRKKKRKRVWISPLLFFEGKLQRKRLC